MRKFLPKLAGTRLPTEFFARSIEKTRPPLEVVFCHDREVDLDMWAHSHVRLGLLFLVHTWTFRFAMGKDQSICVVLM